MRRCLGRRTRGQSCRSQDLDARRRPRAPGGRRDGNAPSQPWKLLQASRLLPLPSPALTPCCDSWTTAEAPARPRPTSSCSGSICSNQLCGFYQPRPAVCPRPSPHACRSLAISPNMSLQAQKLSPLSACRGELRARLNYRKLSVTCVCVCTSACARAHVDLRLVPRACASCTRMCACACTHARVHVHRCEWT